MSKRSHRRKRQRRTKQVISPPVVIDVLGKILLFPKIRTLEEQLQLMGQAFTLSTRHLSMFPMGFTQSPYFTLDPRTQRKVHNFLVHHGRLMKLAKHELQTHDR